MEEYKVGCLCDKNQYHEVISGRIQCNCAFCDIPIEKCDYWIYRSKDREITEKNWKDYLLGFFCSLAIIFLSTSLYAMQPIDFAKKYESYAERIEYRNVNGTTYKTYYYHAWKAEIKDEDGTTTYKREIEESPTAWMITAPVYTEIGILFMPLVCTEMVEGVPTTVYLNDSPKFKNKMPEREV